MPPDSALHRDGKAWTQEREFAALLIERQDMWWGWLAASVLGAKSHQHPPLIVLQHPHRQAPATPGRPARPTTGPGDREAITRFMSRIK